MRPSRHLWRPVAVFGGLLLFGAGCEDAKRFGRGNFVTKSGSEVAKPLGDKLGQASGGRQAQPRPEDALKSSADLVRRARAAARDFQRTSARAAISPELEAAAAELPERRASLAARVAVATEGIRHSRRGAWVKDIRYSFVEDRKEIDALQAKVEAASAQVASSRERVIERLSFWQRVEELAEKSDVPAEVRQQIASVVKEGERAEVALARPDAFIIPLQSTLAEMRELTDSVLRAAERDGPDLAEDAAQRDFSIWQAARDFGKVEDALVVTKRTADRMLQTAALFVARSKRELAAHVLFFLATLIGVLSVKSRKEEWVGEEREGRVARQVAEHPLAVSLLVTMVMSGAFYQATPTAVQLGFYAVATASALVLFPRLLERRLRRIGYRLGAFMLLDALRVFLIDVVPLERMVLTLELGLASLLLGSMLRRQNWQASPFSERRTGLYRAVAWMWLFGAGLGLLGAIFGYGNVAELLGGGVLVSMYMALIFAAAYEALGGTFWLMTQSALLQHVNFIRLYRPRVIAFASRILAWVALALWAWISLDSLTLLGPARRMLWGVVNASLAVGALNVSVGDVGILVLGVLLAVNSARFVRFLLEEDVLPRLEITEGNRQVASSSLYYGVLLLGFFFTLAAVGIELGKLTVLAGALGVGIGFGLQNVVQNFVAGLILMFGGPLKVRDKIQIGDLVGEVRTIGFRASTVRTAQGAEVIVPNSKLIADQVINWTLSDQKRRIEIEIGVQYGVDPDRVIALLREIGKSHPKVLAEPAVDVLFLRHAESSLNFQLLAWTTFDDFGGVRSELTTAINKRLVAEKIGIPFPQRDLNLAAISPEVSEALHGLLAKTEPKGPEPKASKA